MSWHLAALPSAQRSKAKFFLSLLYGAEPKLTKVVLGESIFGAAIGVINDLITIVSGIERCWNNINLANVIVIFSLFSFLAAALAIIVSSPWLAPIVAVGEIFIWNTIFDKVLSELC